MSELSVDEPPSSLLQETDYSLEDAFQLVSLNEENFQVAMVFCKYLLSNKCGSHIILVYSFCSHGTFVSS